MNRRQLAKNALLGLCGALLGKKVEEPVESAAATIQLTCSTEGGRWMPMDKIITYPNHPAGSTEPVPPGWDFLNDKGEDVYNGTC